MVSHSPSISFRDVREVRHLPTCLVLPAVSINGMASRADVSIPPVLLTVRLQVARPLALLVVDPWAVPLCLVVRAALVVACGATNITVVVLVHREPTFALPLGALTFNTGDWRLLDRAVLRWPSR